MRLVTFRDQQGRKRLGGLQADGESLVDLNEAGVEGDLLSLIQAGPESWQNAATLLGEGGAAIAIGDVHILAPIDTPPRNIFCVGKNYVEHAAEFQGSGFDAANKPGTDVPDHPIIFSKSFSTIIGPGDSIPASADPLNTADYEGELTLVIGKGGRGIAKEKAFEHLFGYTIVNDVTSRGLQKKHLQWFLGKNIDGFCPMGPAVVTADEIGDIGELQLKTHVNGELRQDARVSQLIFDIPTLIETISSVTTLVPGDLIATGTPAGVGVGFDPPKFLKPGDVVEISIDRIGVLRNPVG